MGIHEQSHFESFDAGFSCPSCGEFTEHLYCTSCGVEITPEGQTVMRGNEYGLVGEEVDGFIDANKNAASAIVGTRKIEINGKVYEFYNPRMEGNDLIFFLKLGGEDLKVTCNPFSEKRIKYISRKGCKKRKIISPQDYRLILTIIGSFKHNPGKYGLGNLAIFQH